MRQHRLMIFGIAFLLLPFADCLVQEAEAAASSYISGEPEPTPSIESNLPPSEPAQEQPEVLTRGPVHEAFAEPVNLQTNEGFVAPKQPPAVIEEIPAKEKPEGEHFIWVPGYWSWDGDRNNYLWVSGCWRVAPPKMSWVPGYWTRVSTGWRWVAGFWMQGDDNEIEYLNAPPVAVDIEPAGQPPTADSIWVHGCWYWTNDRYVSRPGYWLQGQAGWVWEPSHYVWTPRGYVFSNGHWDYSLERRGVLYAPVYFPSSVVYTRPGFRFALDIVVDIGLLRVNLFCSPRYSHYYFGDYYDDSRVGIYPCFETERMHTWYDPIYQYDRWHSRDPRWEEHERNSYELRRNDRALRPARTYREQESRMSKLPEAQRNNFQIARPISAVSAAKSSPHRFEQSDSVSQQRISKHASDVHDYREQRQKWESTDTSPKGVQPSTERVKEEGARNVQPTEVRREPAAQAERIKDATPRGGVPSSAERSESPGRSERVKVPVSPVTDRVPPPAAGDRLPSTPAEEHRGQDDGQHKR